MDDREPENASAPVDFAAKRKELLSRKIKKKSWRTPRLILPTEPDDIEASETDLIDGP